MYAPMVRNAEWCKVWCKWWASANESGLGGKAELEWVISVACMTHLMATGSPTVGMPEMGCHCADLPWVMVLVIVLMLVVVRV